VNDMNQTKTILLEQVSALADGQLDDEAFERLMAQAGLGREVQAAWQRYHLIGDVLRVGRHERCTDSSTFISRLQQSIALESSTPAQTPIAVVSPQLLHRMKAANEPVFRWKLVAGVASMAAAVAIGWGWIGSVTAPVGAQLAQTQPSQSEPGSVLALSTPAPSVAPGMDQTPQTMLRNARLDELLAAHQQATGGLQPSVFLRNATFEGPSR